MRTSRWPIIAAVLVSAVLVGSVLYIRHTISNASSLVTRGLLDGLHSDARATFRESGFPPSEEVAQAFYEAHVEDGLRYFAVLDDRERPLFEFGEPLASSTRPGTVQQVGDRIRQVLRLGPPRPRRKRLELRDPDASTRAEPEDPARTEPVDQADPDTEPDDSLRAERRRGPPEFPRRRRVRAVVIYELEPVPALQLQAQARQLLGVAGLVSVGLIALAVALSRSLAQRERMQAELERGRRLAALGEMSAVLAHELRNPLASLKGHAQLLAETVEEEPKLQPKVNRLVGETVRLERLTIDLLDFVRSGELQKVAVDPNEVLRAAIASTGPDRITASYLGDALHVPLDTGRVQQALENVLRNGLQASEGAGPVEAFVERDGREVVFRIRDHGPGIPDGDVDRIFEPFVTGKTRGVGLGLSITRRIIEQHGGKVAVANHPDGGAEFRLSVPMNGGR